MSKIIIALDYASPKEASQLVEILGDACEYYKVGLQLIYHPETFHFWNELKKKGKKLFLDAKLNDINTTLENSLEQIMEHWNPDILSVRNNLYGKNLAFVPTLTSDNCNEVVVNVITHYVVCRTTMAKHYKTVNPGVKTISPGVRCFGDNMNEHQEPTVITPWVDFYVVGRPIIHANDPYKAYQNYKKVLEDISGRCEI